MKSKTYNSLTCSALLVLLSSSALSQFPTDESWGVATQGRTYVITPSGFKDPPGPGEGAGVVVDPFRFLITGPAGEAVKVVLTLPDSFVFNGGNGSVPMMNWTYEIGDGWCDFCYPNGAVDGDTITVPINGDGIILLRFGATLPVPVTASPGSYTAALRASFAGKDTSIYRSLEIPINPLSFFPHHVGDIWQYSGGWGYEGVIEENKVVVDSLGPDGVYYLQTTLFGKLSIDTTTFEVRSDIWGGTGYSNLTYKLDADSGDSWTVKRDSFWVLRATVVGVYPSLVFGSNPVTVKQIDYTDSASGLLFNTDYLASDFGFVQQDNDGFLVRIIRGSRIDGVQHGTITVGVHDDHFVPEKIVLNQNYPNPFNPSTTISYTVPAQSHVTLKVFNVLGQEVAKLVNGIEAPGYKSVRFDGSGLPTGVYFYRLQAGSYSATKMLMIVR